jgi:membrane associated rhomboid family serine protease
MGIQDRDYYRDGGRGFFDGVRLGATGWLVAVTCGVFFAQCIPGPPTSSPFVEALAYRLDLVLDGEVWRLVTPLFLHAGLWHLFGNMLILYFLGTRLEERYGPGEFLAFYFVGGVFAQLLYLLAQVSGLPLQNLDARFYCYGASGAVSAVVVLFAFRYPHLQVLLFFVIPMPMWVLAALFVGLDALGAVGGGGNTAYVVHLGGALFGALYYATEFRFTSLFGRPSRAAGRRARPQLRIVPAPPADTPTPVTAAVESPSRPKDAAEPPDGPEESLEVRVDQVLAKVSRSGRDSLTAEEKAILARAGELYKKRRK